MKQRRLSTEEKKELFEMYKTGKYTGKDLSYIFPITPVAINALLRRHGYTSKSQSELQRKYKINENLFDIIDTEEKAYILGLLYADGYNDTSRNSVNLTLRESDKGILEDITKLVQPYKPLQYIRKSSKERSNSYRLVIANKHISNKINELGCTKAKTFTTTFPTEKQVPFKLQRHFIRGYFDGDGSISKGKQIEMSMTGTEEILISIQGIMMQELGFKKTKFDKRYKEKDDNIYTLRYSGRIQCIRFRDWIYKDASLYINRKLEIFNKLV